MGAFRFLTAGESHGRALVAVVEGVPAGVSLDEEYLARHLARRMVGYGRGARMDIERDRASILSGVRQGFTLGSPIALLVPNADYENWREVMSVTPSDPPPEPVTRVRPGHADLAGVVKYGHEDVRNVLERASARETAARVAVGCVARRLLEECGVTVRSCTLSVGRVAADEGRLDWSRVDASPLRCGDAIAEGAMIAAIEEAKAAGDTLGGVFEVQALDVPVGLGSHVQWDRRLDGRLAASLMSIPAVKGVEIGLGFRGAGVPGSRYHDPFERKAGRWRRAGNNAGGIEGGISNGEAILLRGVVKPIPTLGSPLPSFDVSTGEAAPAHVERADVCVVPAAGVIAEAVVAIVLADAVLEKFGGDSVAELRRNLEAYTRTYQ